MVRSIKINLPGSEYILIEAFGGTKDGRNAIQFTTVSINGDVTIILDGDEAETLRASLSQMI